VERLYGTRLDALGLKVAAPSPNTSPTFLAEARLAGAGDHAVQARLVCGCDGLRSKVREAMAAWYTAGKGEVLQEDAEPTTEAQRARRGRRLFEPVKLPSPSTGLQYKMMLFPPSFPVKDLKTGGELQTTSATAYTIPSAEKRLNRRLRLGLLPSKDPELPRTANIIKPKNHHVWGITDAEEMRAYLKESFPQIDVNALVSEADAEAFLEGKVGEFPAPQFVRGMQLFLEEGSGTAGFALLGDSIHAFPPDIGQGVNAALEDVMDFREALLGLGKHDRNPAYLKKGATVLQSPLLLKEALQRYQALRAPEAEAVARIAQVGAPYQYNQSRVREKIFMLGFALRTVLSVVAAKVGLGKVITEPAVMQIRAGRQRYSRVWKRAQRTTAACVAAAAALALKLALASV